MADKKIDEILGKYMPSGQKKNRPLLDSPWSTDIVKARRASPYSAIPGVSRKMVASEKNIINFVESHVGPIELLTDKAKGFAYHLVGKPYSYIGPEDVIEKKLGAIKTFNSDLEYIIENGEIVEDDIIENLRQRTEAFGDSASQYLQLEQELGEMQAEKDYVLSFQKSLAPTDPRYAKMSYAVVEINSKYSKMQRELAKVSVEVLFQDRAVPVLTGALVNLQQGLFYAVKSHAEFEHTTLLISQLIPYIGATSEMGIDRSDALYLAKDITASTIHAMDLSGKSLEAFSNFGPGAQFYSQIGLELASRLQKTAYASKKAASGMSADLQIDVDAILRRS